MEFKEICDIPFCDEKEEFFRLRCEREIKIEELRKIATVILEKSDEELTKEDLDKTEEILFVKKLPLMFGKVCEVLIKKDKILMPLSPLTEQLTHFQATIIYDLWHLGYDKKDMIFYFKDFLEQNSIRAIVNYVRANGRMIWKDISILGRVPFSNEIFYRIIKI